MARTVRIAVGVVAIPAIALWGGVSLVGIVLMTVAYLVLISNI